MPILFFLSAYIAEIIGTTAGFGSSTVFLPLALLFYDFRTSLVLVAFLHIFGNVGRISFFKKGLDKKLLFTFGLPSVFLTFIGAVLIPLISQEFLKGMLGLFLSLYSLLFLWKDNIQAKPTLKNTLIGGGLSGFLAGLIGTGGALRGAFLAAFRLPKEQYIATAAAIALAVDITRIPVYLSQGFLTTKFYWYVPLLLVIALFGSFTGRQFVRLIPQKLFRKIVLLAIFLIGTKLIIDWLS